jgi:TonB family protein
MGYQALLFCPDEKTARTVTQVLNELEFAVESCIEPFAAVKKLMGQHFDAVVVDCDNEQNATLLFKSARNSTSNQTSLAVAVVEGQAGVAKAFRIGANLVLTKPINIEQAKGTLRVARGLLRKSEPGKAPAAAPVPPVATTPVPPKPAPLKPISVVKPAAPVTPSPVMAPRPVEIPPSATSAPSAWPAVAAASSAPAEKDAEVLELDIEESAAKPATASSIQTPSIPHPEQLPAPAAIASPKPAFPAGSPLATSGAASAPAPARKIEDAPVVAKPQEHAAAEALFEKPAEAAPSNPSAIVGSAPSFTFGGAADEAESKGGSKKILFGAVAAVVIAAAAYVGWTQFSGHPSAPATSQVVIPSSTATQPAKPVSVTPAASKPAPSAPAPSAAPVNEPSTSAANDDRESAPQEITLHSTSSSAKPSTSASSAPAKAPVTEPSAPAPMVVKGGKVPAAQSKASAADAPAPSLIGMAAPDAAVPPPNFVASNSSAVKPVLQALTVSQGVSQGLVIKKVSPSYPPTALRMRMEGSVELLATVSKDGSITHIKVISGDTQLAKAASDAVKQWKYKPYQLNGEPVEIQTQVTVNFKLPQ